MRETFVNVKEAAVALGVSERQVLNLIGNGTLPSKRFGKSHMIERADLAKVPKDRKPGPKAKSAKGK